DAYSMLNFIAGKLEVFLKQLGYAARSHVPPTDYDIAMPPLAIDAGLGEQGRNGILITPELGANTRLAAVTTNMPLEPDKPIDIGIKKFCEKCKICAEECPSGAISFADKPPAPVRGYLRWKIDQDKCFTVWNTVATSHPRGCRVCLSVCPYSRKNNWIHRLAKEVDPYDPTGTFSSAMLAMQKGFFSYPGGEEYLPPPDGSNAVYQEPPDWLQTDEWFDL
ncbi:MAG TPA: reductive dehalogenase, partial [Bacteroidales bacterium]|nr:reductive dehalogenase [Bacteroidales bacterium]